MRRMLPHLCLHNTGTMAAQFFLFENRALVLPYRTRNSGLSEAATRYPVYDASDTIEEFSDQMCRIQNSLTSCSKGGRVQKEKKISGLRPSRNLPVGYDAAPNLATCLVDLVRERFAGEETQIARYLSQRRHQSRLRSLLAYDLQRPQMVQNFEAFSDNMAHFVSPKSTTEEFCGRLLSVLVRSQWLKNLRSRDFGPGMSFPDFLKLAEAETVKHVGPTRTNTDLPEVLLTQILEVNQSALDDAALVDQMAALVKTFKTSLSAPND